MYVAVDDPYTYKNSTILIKIAGESHADRIVLQHLTKGQAIVDVLVVVTVGAVSMDRDRILRHCPIDDASVSTQTVTPRRVGVFASCIAPYFADPVALGLMHNDVAPGIGLATSPHGDNQTIFRPGISGVPEACASVAKSGVCRARR